MKRLPANVCLVILGGLAAVSARTTDTCALTLTIVDADSGREIPGVVRIADVSGNVHRAPELLGRGLGLPEKEPITAWSVLPAKTTLVMPKSRFVVEAMAGLERAAAKVEIDLTGKGTAELTLPLTRFSHTAKDGWRSGNTHIHLMKVTRAECDRYLRDVPRGDHLDAIFVSYLERAGADHEYTTNRYTRADFASIEKASGIPTGNGEEHRHNFDGFNEGYGHVMLLNIRDLVQPVSIGPGIMKAGTDGLPLQRGIDAARRDGATILWCHNRWGIEATPNIATGRVRVMNTFDGGPHGSYKDSFYRYWNAGLPISFSTGTDWFIYDVSRVYAKVDGEPTIENWLKALERGRTFITNGPLLTFTVQGKGPGESVTAVAGEKLRVEAKAVGRADFGRIELVRNGEVIARQPSKSAGTHHEATLSMELDATSPMWIALRTPPPPVKDDPALQEKVSLNEYGRELFAHTTPISVVVGGKPHFDRDVAIQLLQEIEQNARSLVKHAKFADDAEKQRVLDVYHDGALAMKRHIEKMSKP